MGRDEAPATGNPAVDHLVVGGGECRACGNDAGGTGKQLVEGTGTERGAGGAFESQPIPGVGGSQDNHGRGGRARNGGRPGCTIATKQAAPAGKQGEHGNERQRQCGETGHLQGRCADSPASGLGVARRAAPVELLDPLPDMGEERGIEALRVGPAQEIELGKGSGDAGTVAGGPIGARFRQSGFGIGDHIKCVGRPGPQQKGRPLTSV